MLKRIFLSVAILAIMVASAHSAEWEIDKPHSSVQFKVTHLVIAKVKGSFNDFSATLNFDGKNLAAGSVEMQVDVASVDTDDEKRDKHLVSSDLFDAEKYPKMTFKSTKVIPGTGNEFQLVGDLTIRGVTKEVTFDCEFNGAMDFMGGTRAGFSAETKIDRLDYGVSWNRNLDAGGVLVGNEVTIMLELEFSKVS